MTTPIPALRALVQVIEDEAARNGAFAERLFAALRPLAPEGSPAAAARPAPEAPSPARPARTKGRRAAAVLDPVALARQGEAALRESLSGLSVDQLKDIIAGHGMDPGKQTTRWRNEARLIAHIETLALARSKKGEAFL